jgi:hypothetical protein
MSTQERLNEPKKTYSTTTTSHTHKTRLQASSSGGFSHPALPSYKPSLNYKLSSALQQNNQSTIKAYTFYLDENIGVSEVFAKQALTSIGFSLKKTKPTMSALKCVLLAFASCVIEEITTDENDVVIGCLHSQNKLQENSKSERYGKPPFSAPTMDNLMKELAKKGYAFRIKGFRGEGYHKGLATTWVASTQGHINTPAI